MKLHLLGTGSPAGCPPPFSDEPIWEEARRRGGADIRTASGALIDDDLKIDFSPDTYCQVKNSKRNLAKVRTILFTHHHNDHVYPPYIQNMAVPPTYRTSRGVSAPEPVDIYANEATTNKIKDNVKLSMVKDIFNFHLVKAGDSFETAQGDKVLALPAVHEQGAMLYRITRDGKSLFYGHDSGPYPDETLEALADGPALDIALFDCNYAGITPTSERHMNIENVIEMAKKLRENGAITDKTRCIATHFSPMGGLLHDDLVKAFLPHQIEVAYDNMIAQV